MVNGACFVRLARALPSTKAFALTGRGALRPPYPGCRSLRSLAPGYKQTRLRRVWDDFQPSPLTPKSARKPSCRTLHTSLRNSHGPWELDSQPLGIELPAAGNIIPSPWESEYQPRALDVPAAGTRSTSRGHSKYLPLAIELPALGNGIASRRQSDCQALWQPHCPTAWQTQAHRQANRLDPRPDSISLTTHRRAEPACRRFRPSSFPIPLCTANSSSPSCS